MANQPQNQSGGGNQPMGQKPVQQPAQSNGFGSSEPVRKPASPPVQSVAKEQGTLAPYHHEKAETEPATNWVPAFPSSPAERRTVETQTKATGALPLQDESEGGRRFLTRGRVIATIAVLLIASMYLDRAPVNAPEDKSASPKNEGQLAVINPPSSDEAVPTGRVKTYFNNGIADPTMACEKVFAVLREVKEPSPEAALQQLFAGPDTKEGDEGYFTSISPGVMLNSVNIDDNTATVDVSGHLAWNVERGSCRAKAISAQITETMKQFTGVKDVAILVDGKADNALTR